MDLRKIKKLIELLEDSSLNEMEITSGEERIALRRSTEAPQGRMQAIPLPMVAAERAPEGDKAAATDSDEPQGEPVTAPIVGTYYEAATPGAQPFVRPGKRVAKGDTLCIIEAMKMMNEIKAPAAATVSSIEAHNAQPVEFGQVLMYLDN